MRKKLLSLTVAIVCLFQVSTGYAEKTAATPAPSTPAAAQPEAQIKASTPPVVVTATRTPVSEQDLGKTTNVVTQDEIEIAKDASIITSLQQMPGVRVQQLGGPGFFTSVRIRGLRPFDTKLLVNGLPFADASAAQESAEGIIQDFLQDNWQQIEVVRGASATLYGSDSVGGTINLIPKWGQGKPTLAAAFEGGTLNTYKQTYSLSGGDKGISYLGGYTRYTSDGIGGDNPYENNSYTALLKYDAIDKLELGFNFNAADTRSTLDQEPTIVAGKLKSSHTPNGKRDGDFFNYGTYATYHATDKWDHTVRFGVVDVDKEFKFFGPFPSAPKFFGDTYDLEYQTNLQVNEQNLATFGFQREVEHFKQITQDFGTNVEERTQRYHNDYYLQDQLNLFDESLFITGGIRLSDYETVGFNVNGEGSIAYLLKATGTKVHSHIGTGFRAPSLFELFGAGTFGGQRVVFGNRNLDPEESLSWDIGVDQKFCQDKGTAGVTFFRQDFDQFIEFGAFGYQNVNGAVAQGIESELKFQFTPALSGRGFYTFTDSEDTNGRQFVGIPEHLWGFDIAYQFFKRFKFLVRSTFMGKNQFNVFLSEPTFNVVRTTADNYFKVDAVISYEVNKNCEVYARGENIFNADIQENGFDGIPFMVYGGVKVKI